MRHFRNFLALWAGILLAVFVVAELVEAIKTLIANSANAFAIATDWRIVVISMIVSFVVTLGIMLFYGKKRK